MKLIIFQISSIKLYSSFLSNGINYNKVIYHIIVKTHFFQLYLDNHKYYQ